MSKQITSAMIQYWSLTDMQKVKFPAGEVRDLIARKTFYESATVSAVTILGWVADNLQISFEERKNILLLIDTVTKEPNLSKTELSEQLNNLLAIANHYTK